MPILYGIAVLGIAAIYAINKDYEVEMKYKDSSIKFKPSRNQQSTHTDQFHIVRPT